MRDFRCPRLCLPTKFRTSGLLLWRRTKGRFQNGNRCRSVFIKPTRSKENQTIRSHPTHVRAGPGVARCVWSPAVRTDSNYGRGRLLQDMLSTTTGRSSINGRGISSGRSSAARCAQHPRRIRRSRRHARLASTPTTSQALRNRTETRSGGSPIPGPLRRKLRAGRPG